MSAWRGVPVLVTGATGFIGSHLARRLHAEGAEVTAFVLDPDPRSELYRSGLADRIGVVMGALQDRAAVERAVATSEARVIFHLGAQTLVPTSLRVPVETFESNIAGSWNVFEAATRMREQVERVVVASSDKAYGAMTDVYTEDMPLRGRSPYDVSKSCTDLLAQSYWHTFELPVVIARAGNIFGGGDLNWSRIVPGTIRSLLEGARPVIRSDGRAIREYMYVADVVDAYMAMGSHALDEVAGEAFNFSTEVALSVLEVYDRICTAAGQRVEPEILDRAPAEIAEQRLSAEKARSVLGWKPRHDIDEALAETVAWYRGYLAG